MKRRTFITMLGGAVAAWSLAAQAQIGPARRIGALIGADESDLERQMWIEDFRRALVKLGWTEGRNIRIYWRWAAADRDRAKTYAAELVTLQPDLIFVDNTFTADALQRATHTLPVVFAHITDPVTSGFVRSLAHPDSNITGFSDSEPESRGKLVELAKQLAPDVTRIAIIGSMTQTHEIESFRQTGRYTGRILKGERPGDLPVMLPTRFEFVVNLKTANAIGVTIPPSVLAIADEVIE